MVPPLRVQVPPGLTVSDKAALRKKAEGLFITMVCVVSAEPVFVTVPSSTVTLPAVRAADRFIAHAPVPSLPAENTALSPDANVVVAIAPAGSVLQVAPVVFQVPVAVPWPEPAVAPFMSQYFVVAACAELVRMRPSRISAETNFLFIGSEGMRN